MRKSMFNRIIASMLTVVMVVSLFPMSALAEEVAAVFSATEPINLARAEGVTQRASSVYNDGSYHLKAENAFDGDTTTAIQRWAPSESKPTDQHLEIDFAKETTVNTLHVYFDPGNLWTDSLTIKTSDNGTDWTTGKIFSFSPGAYKELLLDEPVTSRYLRANFSTTDGRGTNVVELEVYNITSPDYVTGVRIDPPSLQLKRGESKQLTATVEGFQITNRAVTWSLLGNSSENTKISETGKVSVAQDETATEMTIKAVSNADSSKYAEVTLQVPLTFTLEGRMKDATTAALNWDAVDGAGGYKVYIGEKGESGKYGATATALLTQEMITGTTYEATGLTAGHAYPFQIVAYNADGEELCRSNVGKVAVVAKKVMGDGSGLYNGAPTKVPVSDLALNMDFVGPVISDSRYHYWCVSPIMGEDGRYHIFTSRNSSEVDFGSGWATICEIAHLVSDTPEGPYREVEVVFDSAYFRENYGLSSAAPHNSRITKIDDTYCLMFMVQVTPGSQLDHATVLATSKSVNGPWEIQDGGTGTGITIPPYDTKPAGGGNMTNNADILKVGSKYHIYFRSQRTGIAQFYLATADALGGPYTINPKPIIDNKQNIEDLDAFEWNGKYYLLADDNFGDITGVDGAGILFESRDGITFDRADAMLGFADMDEYIELTAEITNSYGPSTAKHERPALLQDENGQPAYFFAPNGTSIDGLGACQNYVYKINPLPEYDVTLTQTAGGTLSADLTTAVQTRDVTITATPASGFKLKVGTITATDSKGNSIKLTADNKFSMPRGGATVTAQFVDASGIVVDKVAITPATASVSKGASVLFAASVTGKGDFSSLVRWSITGGNGASSISQDGILTVASNERAKTTLTVKAVSAEDETKFGTATVTVEKPMVNYAPKVNEGAQYPAYTASAHYAGGGLDCKPAYAFDGVTGWTNYNIWTPAVNNTDAWIAVDFGKAVTVQQLKLYDRINGESRTSAVTVQKSEDGTNWLDVETLSFAPGDEVKVGNLTQPVTSRYLRLAQIVGTVAGKGIHLLEAEFYGMGPTVLHGITVDSAITNGALTTAASAENEDEVTIAVAPEAGYRLVSGSLKAYKTGDEAATIAVENSKFFMPDYAVTITAKFERTPSGGSSGSAGNSDTTTKTENNGDGSTSTITTDQKTGTVVETAKYPDGSKVITTTTKDGAASSVVTVPKAGEKTAVTIPTAEKPAAGMVAVIVNADGTKEVVKTSVATADGMKIVLADGATIELIDNTKTFTDVKSGDWHKDAVTFATSRELFNGTSATSFTPNAPMTRAMLMTVLYRYEGANVTGTGDSWYADSMAWAKEIALSDGTNPDGNVTREQLATMLYRYAKPTETAKADTSKFTDADKVSTYASEAMNWAIATGLITGKANNLLDPQGNATRAEVATILMRFCENY